MIKLIALDLDGTILNSEGSLDLKTKVILEETIEKGIEVVIATGRVFSALPEAVLGMKGIRYVITSNGANVVNLGTKEVIYTNFIGGKAVETVMETLKKYDFMTEVFTCGNAYIEEAIYRKIEEKGSPFNNTSYLLSTRKPVVGLYGYTLAHKNSIENINLNFIKPEDKEMMRKVLASIKNISITSSFIYNLEICGFSTSKADALQQLCKKLGLYSNEVMACGDSDNDIEMLRFAGMPVAVANAKEEVKKFAQYIAPRNDESGVAEIVQNLIF